MSLPWWRYLPKSSQPGTMRYTEVVAIASLGLLRLSTWRALELLFSVSADVVLPERGVLYNGVTFGITWRVYFFTMPQQRRPKGRWLRLPLRLFGMREVGIDFESSLESLRE